MTVFPHSVTKSDLRPSRAFALTCMGLKGSTPSPETLALLERAERDVMRLAAPRICYAVLPLRVEQACVMLGEHAVFSTALAKTFMGCEACIVFAATLGAALDRAISIRALTSPAEALALDAAANACIEAVCDAFCKHEEAEYGALTMRFSPGYGDYALNEGKFLLDLLDSPRRIGLSLTSSCMMAPVKSVSAVMGIRK